MAQLRGAAEPMTREGFGAMMDSLGVGPAELAAVLMVESREGGFLADRRPAILFERHYFHRLTGGRFSADHPDISSSATGGYAWYSKEYPRLEKAMKLDRAAALRSCSWGAGQVMGDNFKLCGWPDIESFVADMMASEDLQLKAMAAFMKSKKLVEPLKAHDWAAVAKGYNGANYAKYKYDQRLAGEYLKFTTEALVPDIDVRRVQQYLRYLGVQITADGLYGKMSRAAVVPFKQQAGLAGGERIDNALIEALRARVAQLPK